MFVDKDLESEIEMIYGWIKIVHLRPASIVSAIGLSQDCILVSDQLQLRPP